MVIEAYGGKTRVPIQEIAKSAIDRCGNGGKDAYTPNELQPGSWPGTTYALVLPEQNGCSEKKPENQCHGDGIRLDGVGPQLAGDKRRCRGHRKRE